MAAVDTVSTLLDQLDDMVTILRLYDLGDTFRVFQVERNVRGYLSPFRIDADC